MTTHWRIYKDAALVVFDVSGPSGVLEAVDALRAVAAHPDFDPGMRRLYLFADDLGPGTALDSTQGAFVSVLAEQVTHLFRHPAPVAFVFHPANSTAANRFAVTTAHCDDIYRRAGLGPMLHRKFATLPDALQWLDLPVDFIP